MVASTFQPE